MSGAVLKLPVAAYYHEISRLLRLNLALIVTAMTGSGKSTGITDFLQSWLPVYLADQGYCVIVAVPRRVLARQLAAWVSQMRNEEVGQSVGFHTGMERCFSSKTRIFFVTDGLQEIRELLGHTKRRAVLVIDELHEWNIHQEILLAEAKRALKHGDLYRLVIMSATLNAQGLSDYLCNAPVLTIPGRMFPVVEHPEYTGCPIDLVERLLKEGKKTLVFVPGKREIRKFITELKQRKVEAVLLPLHGEQSVAEQERCFQDYELPLAVFSTNIGQSGLTPKAQVVVDTGKIRMQKVIDGIEGIYTDLICLDDCYQRMGRLGRTEDGDYYPCFDKWRLSKHVIPEIERVLLETTVLRVKSFTGRDISRMDLFHRPKLREIERAKQMLRTWGYFTDNGEVTELGREVALMPVSLQSGGMLIKGRQNGVFEEVLTIAAIVEARGIVSSDPSIWGAVYCPDEKESDLIAQLKVYDAAVAALQAAGEDPEALQLARKKLEENGIVLRKLETAIEKRAKIAQNVKSTDFVSPATLRRENLLAAIRKGFGGHFFIRTEDGWVNGDGDVRILLDSSIVPHDSKYLLGIPWNLDLQEGEPGEHTQYFIQFPTVVSKADLPSSLKRLHSQRSKDEHRERSLAGKNHKDRSNRLPRNSRASRN